MQSLVRLNKVPKKVPKAATFVAFAGVDKETRTAGGKGLP